MYWVVHDRDKYTCNAALQSLLRGNTRSRWSIANGATSVPVGGTTTADTLVCLCGDAGTLMGWSRVLTFVFRSPRPKGW